MHQISLIRYSFYYIKIHKKRYILSLFLLTIVFILINYILFTFDIGNSVRNTIDSTLNSSTKLSGKLVLNLEEENPDNIQRFMEEANKESYVETVGELMAGSFDNYIPDLRNLQLGYEEEVKKNSDGYDGDLTYYAYLDTIHLLGIGLEKGEWISNEKLAEMEKNNVTGIYLGYAYNDIPVGSIFECEDGGKCQVLGILKKDSKCLASKVYLGDYIRNFNLLTNMDYIFLIPESYYYYTSPSLVVFNKEVSFEEGASRLKELADKYGVSLELCSFEEMIIKSESDKRVLYIILTVIVMALMVVYSLVVYHSYCSSNKNDKYEYDIMKTYGAEETDIIGIMVISDMFNWLISFIISVFIGVFAVYHLYVYDRNYTKYVYYISFHMTIYKLLIISSVLVGISMLLPLIKVKRKSSVEKA